jgi:colanic acid biosynthesis glycosyl transferase WcaI
MKKILLLSPFFYPEPISTGKYNTVVAKELSKEVDSIDVFCAHPIYPKWKVEPSDKQLDGITAIRGGRWLKFPNNVLLRRAVLEIWFCFFVFFKLITSNKKYTHIVAIFPPSLFMLLVPILTKKSKLVGIVHDLQGIYANRKAGKLKKTIFSIIKWVEKRSFKACDKLIFLSEDMMKLAEKEYNLDHSKNVVRYPFVTINEFKNKENLNSIIPNSQKSIVYSGALGEKQAPEKLVNFMEQFVAQNSDFKAYIFSQGPIFDSLKLKYTNITFNSLVDENDLSELLLRSSIQVLPQETGTSDGSLPSKLPNLLASGCRILCITDAGSELVRLLNDYSLAEVNHNWEVEDLILQTTKLVNKINSNDSDQTLLNKFTKSALVDSVIN